eukprot:6899319-Alexandrium_andersonii.AAC.1
MGPHRSPSLQRCQGLWPMRPSRMVLSLLRTAALSEARRMPPPKCKEARTAAVSALVEEIQAPPIGAHQATPWALGPVSRKPTNSAVGRKPPSPDQLPKPAKEAAGTLGADADPSE